MKHLLIHDIVVRILETIAVVVIIAAVIALVSAIPDPTPKNDNIVLDGKLWTCEALDPRNGQCGLYLKRIQ